MKKFSEAVLAKHKHMSHKASPYHAHSQGLEYTPSGKEVVRPIDTADAGYGGEAVSDAEGGEANAGIASKKAVSPMPMPTLVKPGLDKAKKKPGMKEGFDPEPADIAKMLVAKHGKNVTKDHIRALEQDRDSHTGLDHDEIMKHVKKLQEETERERLLRLRSFVAKNKKEGLGKAMVEEEQTDEGYRGPFPKQWKREMERIPSTSTVVHKDRTVVTTKKDGKVVDVKTTKNEEVDLNELKDSTYRSYLANPARQHPKIKDVIAARNAQKTGDEKPMERLAKTVQHRQHALRTLKKRYEKSQPAPEPGPIGSRFDEEASSHVAHLKPKADSPSKDHFEISVDSEDHAAAHKKFTGIFGRSIAKHYEVASVKPRNTNEEVEQVDELKKSTLASYAKKATDDVSYHSFTAGSMSSKDPERLTHDKKAMKRQAGVNRAVDKLAKSMEEATSVTDYSPPSKGGTRAELLAKLAKSKKPEHATAARKAGASQDELKAAMMKEENDGTEADQGEYGYEGDMAMSQLKSIIRNAKDLHDNMEPQTDLPEWLQSKITLAADYIQTAADYWRSEKEEVSEGRMKDIATNKAEDERLHAQDVLGGPVKPKSSVVGGKGQPKNLRNLASRLATKAMKAGHSVTEEEKKSGKVPRVGPMEKALEEEVWDKPMPDSKKQGSLSPEQKAKAKARAERAGRSYPNMIDNMWASKQ